MDLNRDNLLSYTEVQKFVKFDKDGDGSVSEDEAKVGLSFSSLYNSIITLC